MKYLLLLFTTLVFSQQTQWVDFKKVKGELEVHPNEKTITGKVQYFFDIKRPIDSIVIDAKNMSFEDLLLDGKATKFSSDSKYLIIKHPFKEGNHQLQFTYKAKPKQAIYFIGTEDEDAIQIWTQGQGKYTSHWFPSFDDVNEKLIFNLSIQFKNGFEVISNGQLKSKKQNASTTTWEYGMTKPMSSYLLTLVIGKFLKKTDLAASKVPLEFYIEPIDSNRFEPTYRDSKRIFDFLEKEIGIAYPWKNYKQIPVRDFLYAGMENTSATTFAHIYVVDSIGFHDRSYTNVNAHELAHQWFGNLITAESSQHHWLQEGFATYYALLAEKELYGDDFYYHYLHEKAQELKFASRTDTIPVLNPKASSLTFYQKGAWALFVLHQKIGDKAFKKVIQNYLRKYQYQNVTTSDFLAEIEKVCDFDTKNYSKVWLEDYKFNTFEANELLKKNKSTNLQLQLDALAKVPFQEKKESLLDIMKSDAYFKVKENIFKQLRYVSFEDCQPIIEAAFATAHPKIRQTLAEWFTTIPESFQIEYESLLEEPSYVTREVVLYNLWQQFPKSRNRYLDQTKTWIGFNDYNLRILWLALALRTPDYSDSNEKFYEELVDYSSSKYTAATRQNALNYLIGFQIINPEVLKNLVNGTTHHLWQFTKFSRDNIRKLIKNPSYRILLEELNPSLNEAEQAQLQRLLTEK